MDAQHPQAQQQAQAQPPSQGVQQQTPQGQQGQPGQHAQMPHHVPQPHLTRQGQQAQFANPVQGQLPANVKSDKDLLHGYIYDYLVKQKLPETAKIFFKEAELVGNGKTTTITVGNPTSPESEENAANGMSNGSSNSSTPRPFSSQDPKKPNGTNRPVSQIFPLSHRIYVY